MLRLDPATYLARAKAALPGWKFPKGPGETARAKWTVVCPKGHVSEKTFYNIEAGSGCGVCSGKLRTLADIKKLCTSKHTQKYGYGRISANAQGRDRVEIYCYACKKYFIQPLSQHLLGYGCWDCGQAKKTASRMDFLVKNPDMYERANATRLATDKANPHIRLQAAIKLRARLKADPSIKKRSAEKWRATVAKSNTHFNTTQYKKKIHKWGKKIFTVQGFEPQALNHLRECGYLVSDIAHSYVEGKPNLYYTHLEKKRLYVPDFFIKSENCIVEVKGVWTFGEPGSDLRKKNLAKLRACRRQGYSTLLIVLNSKGQILKRDYRETNEQR